MIKTLHHKINILLNDFKKIIAFGNVLYLSSRLNLDEGNRHARSVHWLPTDAQRTPCHCYNDGMNQVGSATQSRHCQPPGNLWICFSDLFGNFSLGISSFQKCGYLVSLFFDKLYIVPYQCSSGQDFGADELSQLIVTLPLLLH